MKLVSLIIRVFLCLVVQQQLVASSSSSSSVQAEVEDIHAIRQIPRIEINSGSPHAFEVTSDDGVKSGPLHVYGREGDIRIETDDGYTVCPQEEEMEEETEERHLRRGGDDNNGDGTRTRTRTRRPTRNVASFMFCEPCQNAEGQDDICPSRREVGRDRPDGITRGVRRPTERSTYIQHLHDNEGGNTYRNRARDRSDRNRGQSGENTSRQRQRQLRTGTLNNLVILMKFQDHTNRPLPSVDDLDVLFNSPDVHPTFCPTGSIRTIFKDNSNGQLDLVSTIVDWITLPETEAYYANGNHGFDPMIHQAIHETLHQIQNDATVNFQDFDMEDGGQGDGKIDAITILHSGYAAEWGGTDDDGAYMTSRIWSHKWSMWKAPYATWTSDNGVSVYDYNISPALWHIRGTDIGRIGVIAHELGHFLGLPDLYDGQGGQGLGSYSLMGNSWGFDGSQYYPPALDPWSKLELGWATAETLTHTQQVTLAPSYTTHQVIKITHGYPQGEYLLIENRQKLGSDYTLPQEGLVIYHVDEQADHYQEGHPGQTNWPSNGNHYSIAVVAADGKYELEKGVNRGDEGDVWYGSTMTLGVGGQQHPNTDAYQGGNIQSTGNTIRDISDPSTIMTFTYDNGVAAPTTPAPVATPAPVSPPPTQAPVPAPTTAAPVSSPPTQAPVPAPTTAAPVSSPPTQAPVPAPTTAAPTLSPTASPVTPSPTPSPPTTPAPTTEPPVVAYQRPMRVQVHTDNYPGETSWKIYDLCSPDDQILLEHGPYNQPNVDEIENFVLESNSMYRIEFADSYGDGICCSYGQGSFQVLLGDEVVAEGGEFHEKTTVLEFGASSCDDSTATEDDNHNSEEEEGCVPDSSWVHIDRRGKTKNCSWASKKPRRWSKKDEHGVTAKDACCLQR